MNKKATILLITTFLVFIGGFLYFQLSSPAVNNIINTPPGCIKTSSIGGCFGKNNLLNFKIIGQFPSCLTIRPHTCQGARLEIENLCPSNVSVTIENRILEGTYNYLSYKLDGNGKPLEEKEVSYSDKDQPIKLNGMVSGKTFQLSYTKTRALCQ